MSWFKCFFFSIALLLFSSSLYAGTVASAYAGRCSFGYHGNEWEGINEATKKAMISVIRDDKAGPEVKSHISQKGVKRTCNGSASFFSNSTYIEVRTCRNQLQTASPSSFGLRFVHEHCHSVGQKGDLYAKYDKAGINCSGVSSYAASKPREQFAEACTAYLVSPHLLNNCTGGSAAAKKFFSENVFKGNLKGCTQNIKAGGPGNWETYPGGESDLYDTPAGSGGAPPAAAPPPQPASNSTTPESDDSEDLEAKATAENNSESDCETDDEPCLTEEDLIKLREARGVLGAGKVGLSAGIGRETSTVIADTSVSISDMNPSNPASEDPEEPASSDTVPRTPPKTFFEARAVEEKEAMKFWERFHDLSQ